MKERKELGSLSVTRTSPRWRRPGLLGPKHVAAGQEAFGSQICHRRVWVPEKPLHDRKGGLLWGDVNHLKHTHTHVMLRDRGLSSDHRRTMMSVAPLPGDTAWLREPPSLSRALRLTGTHFTLSSTSCVGFA